MIRPVLRISVALLTLVGAGCAVAAIGQESALQSGPSASKVLLLADQGPIRFKISKAGRAVIRAKSMSPGESRSGHVRVGITGADARVQLKRSKLESPRGPFGGKLAPVLKVTIKQVKGPSAKKVYKGSLKKLTRVNLGHWSPGELKRFKVKVKFPDLATGQDTLQGAKAKFGLVWRASA